MIKGISLVVLIFLVLNALAACFVITDTEITEISRETLDSKSYSFTNYNSSINSCLSDFAEPLESISLHQTLDDSNYAIDELISIQYELRGYTIANNLPLDAAFAASFFVVFCTSRFTCVAFQFGF